MPRQSVSGKPTLVDAAPAGIYDSALQVATTAGRKEPLLDIRIGATTFQALLDSGSSVSLLGQQAMAAAEATGASHKREVRALRLTTGWSKSATSLRCKIHWAAGSRRQRFLCVPDLCRDVVLGRDFLTVTGISLHVALGGWTIGTELQCMVPFVKGECRPKGGLDSEEIYDLQAIFAERPAPTANSEIPAPNNPTHLASQVNVDPRLAQVLENFSPIITATPGCTTFSEHCIDTGDSQPVRCKLRPVNAKKKAIMDSCFADLLEHELIRPSTSQWTSAPVLVAKKSGGFRLAIDYRPLNSRTRVPAYPMPRTDWLLAQLGQAQWFSSFDLSQGFFQIPVREQDIPKTAFICHQGTYEFTRMPFGVAGGPATFLTLMDTVLDGVNLQWHS